MKKLIAILLCLVMVMPFVMAEEKTSITLWTYPVGHWGSEEVVNEIIANFNEKYPNIEVKVQYLDYKSGDDQVTSAIEANTAPDIILEGPERLVANWGAAGKMVDLSDLWTEEALADIGKTSEKVVAACKNAEGVFYEYPLCMTAHTMTINYKAFEEADALQYINEETRTWTTEGFVNASKALADKGFIPSVIYCGSKGGDQGTRALVMNLYSASFTNPEHTAYTMNSENGIKGFTLLKEMLDNGTITADAGIEGGDEIALFCNGTVAMAFCWNAAAAVNNKTNLAEGVVSLPMAFPSDDGVPELAGGIWGFGIFDNGDAARVEAAKTFIRFVSDDEVQGPKSVYATGFFPVRASFGDIYTGTEKEGNAEFSMFMPYLGDYYNVTKGWANQRTEWWNLLQRIYVTGGDIVTEVEAYITNANASLQ